MATTAVKMAWRMEPGSRAILEIDVPEDEVARAMDRAYAALAQRVTVPGFRRGKAPRAVLERHVGTEALREEALKELLPERYAQAVEQAGLSPVARPSFEVTEGADGKGLRLTATVEVLPKIELPDYRTIRVTRDPHPVTDADVDRVLEDLRVRHGHLVSGGSEPARRGDYVLLKVAKAPAGMGRLEPGKEVLVEIGGGLLPAEVEAALEGVRAGEDREVQPAGSEGTADLHVLDVRRKELPPLDDAFARVVSDEPTLAGLRDRLRERLGRERAEAEERDLRERVLDAVVAQVTIDLPDSLVGHEVEHMLEDLTRRVRSRGLSLETYLRSQEKDEAGLRADLRPGAERRVRVRLVLDEVARREGLTLTEEEMARAVENLAQESREDVRKMQTWLAQGDRLVGLREHLLRQKAMAMLVACMSGDVAAGEAPPASAPGRTAEAPGVPAG